MATDQGNVFAVRVSGEHNGECKAAAGAGRIPQTLSPRMVDWCKECFRAGFSVDDVDLMCLRENYPQHM